MPGTFDPSVVPCAGGYSLRNDAVGKDGKKIETGTKVVRPDGIAGTVQAVTVGRYRDWVRIKLETGEVVTVDAGTLTVE